MAATIGIKIANGEFYSILNEYSTIKKRLVLTTVHNNQSSVQIDMYKSDSKTMADAHYIGSLMVENIKPRQKGVPSIELTISSVSDGTISADALDLDPENNSGHKYLSVSLQSLDKDSRDYNVPDFELDDEPPPVGLYEKATKMKKAKKKRSRAPIVLLIILLLLAAGFALWYFYLRHTDVLDRAFTFVTSIIPAKQDPGPAPEPAPQVIVQPQTQAPAPAPQTQPTPQPSAPEPTPAPITPVPVAPAPEPAPVQQTPAPAPQTAPPPVIQAPAQAPAPIATPQRTRPAPPVASYNVPATIPREGVAYRIRYGDTLWDIAEAFYRNPWLYPRIARFNNIRNPDRIISGTTIRIPPRN
jgi:outer membrane biosynthesis protein TonB